MLKPCKTCGRNFMPTNIGEYDNDHCNVCINSYKNKMPKKTKKEIDMETSVKILIEVPREMHIRIEEICMNEGTSFSEFFMNLLKLRDVTMTLATKKQKEKK